MPTVTHSYSFHIPFQAWSTLTWKERAVLAPTLLSAIFGGGEPWTVVFLFLNASDYFYTCQEQNRFFWDVQQQRADIFIVISLSKQPGNHHHHPSISQPKEQQCHRLLYCGFLHLAAILAPVNCFVTWILWELWGGGWPKKNPSALFFSAQEPKRKTPQYPLH